MRPLAGLLLAMLPLPALGSEPAPGLTVTITGPPVTVTSYARDACEPWDIPDAPARAIRTASGEVLLFAAHLRTRVLRGPSLLAVRPDCRVVYAGRERDDPAAFDDRAWLASPYTRDGTHIFAVVHNEFQGHRRPSLCPSGRYLDCWYNALTVATSDDGGHSFTRPAAGALLAALPYRYTEVTGAHRGYFNPSNIVAVDGGFAMLAFATEALAQRPGNCLLRTPRLDDTGAWRGWDGTGFTVRFIDPYQPHDTPERHVCAPVGAGRLRWPVTSLVRHTPSGLFIATMMDAAATDHGGGVYVATSRDLIDWGAPSLIWQAVGEGAWTCAAAAPVAYPSLLDPASASRSFDTVGATAVLLVTRFNPDGCRLGADRDLVRLPVAIAEDREKRP